LTLIRSNQGHQIKIGWWKEARLSGGGAGGFRWQHAAGSLELTEGEKSATWSFFSGLGWRVGGQEWAHDGGKQLGVVKLASTSNFVHGKTRERGEKEVVRVLITAWSSVKP